jgi:hypothetical protein
MLRVLVALAFLAVAFAVAPVCNTTIVCLKEGETGCSSNSAPDVSWVCATGTQCTSNTCQRNPRLGESCSGSGIFCWDANYDITCDNSVCRYQNIYGPGESCKVGDGNYVNGGCYAELTCDSTTKTCTNGLALGDACTTAATIARCPVHSYCNGTCVPRLSSGAECVVLLGNAQCDESLICTNRGSGTAATCQAPFAQNQGADCSTQFDCARDTRCAAGKCVAAVPDDQVCTNDIDVCDDSHVCECSSKTSGRNVTLTFPAECEDENEYNTKSLIDDYTSMQACAKSKNCLDYWSLTARGFQSGPSQCIAQCLKGDFETRFHKRGLSFNKCGSGSGAGVVIPSIAVLIALLFALLA